MHVSSEDCMYPIRRGFRMNLRMRHYYTHLETFLHQATPSAVNYWNLYQLLHSA